MIFINWHEEKEANKMEFSHVDRNKKKRIKREVNRFTSEAIIYTSWLYSEKVGNWSNKSSDQKSSETRNRASLNHTKFKKFECRICKVMQMNRFIVKMDL